MAAARSAVCLGTKWRAMVFEDEKNGWVGGVTERAKCQERTNLGLTHGIIVHNEHNTTAATADGVAPSTWRRTLTGIACITGELAIWGFFPSEVK